MGNGKISADEVDKVWLPKMLEKEFWESHEGIGEYLANNVTGEAAWALRLVDTDIAST